MPRLGFSFILMFILSVLNFANCEKWLQGILNENGTIQYSYAFKDHLSCLNQKNIENSTHVAKITFPQKKEFQKKCNIDLKNTTNLFKDLIEKVTIDCNGRAECDSSQSEILIRKYDCFNNSRSPIIHIGFSCKSADINNITVFNIGLDWKFKNITYDGASYLVLRLNGHRNIHRNCKINGNEAFSIRVLHIDFGPNAKCNEVHSNYFLLCSNRMDLSPRVSRETKDCNYTWNPSLTFKINECQAKEVDIDVRMSTGFVWIELSASKGVQLSCSNLETNNEATSSMPSSDGQQSNYLYDIVIPVSAAFLVLLIVIGSFVFCVCRRNSRFQVWKRNRRESAIRNRQNGAYNNVSTDDILDPTYNTVSAPGAQGAMKGISPGHTSDDDYADISHVNTANNSQPLVTSVAYKKPGKPMKTPTSPEPSFKVEKQAEEAPDEDLGVTYATVNKVKKVDNTEPRGAVSAAPEGPTLTEADGEYSHLAHFEKKKNYENVYNC